MKDFAPNCPLYVQILKPENKFHVKFAGESEGLHGSGQHCLLRWARLSFLASQMFPVLFPSQRGP